jgi:arylsulfatase A-like enzyme
MLQGAGFTTFGLSANPVIGRGSGYHAGSETFMQAPFARADAVREGFESWLEEQQGRRWFAYLHFMDPHEPYEAPPPFAGTFTQGYAGPLRDPKRWAQLLERVNFRGEPAGITAADLSYLVGAYDEEIRSWDEAFGHLLAALERLGLLEQTIVAVTSDHGEEFLEHGRLKHGLQLFDESLHVPLLIRAPGRLPPGRRAAQVETRALPGALLALMGVAAGAPWTPHLLELKEADRLPAYSHTTLPALGHGAHRPSLVSVRDTYWKLIRELDSDDAAMFFDLSADPGERRDVAAIDPARMNDYRARLRLWLERGAVRGAVPLDPDLMERLQALGYVH